jgi:hypothetical protein
MSLRQIIKRAKLYKTEDRKNCLEIPETPMLFSIEEEAYRNTPPEELRNMKFYGILKSWFESYMDCTQPVVVKVIFYIKPMKSFEPSPEALKLEKSPAVCGPELCDFMLSFLEMIRGTLITCCRQIVRIEMEKYYSNKPRTFFKLIPWSEHIELQRKDTAQTDPEGVSNSNKSSRVQPKRARNVESTKKHTKANDASGGNGNKKPSNGSAATLLLSPVKVQKRRIPT